MKYKSNFKLLAPGMKPILIRDKYPSFILKSKEPINAYYKEKRERSSDLIFNFSDAQKICFPSI